jgi:diketogulonate reductase-like aldo/keto reductase
MIPTISANGAEIPVIGFGTWQLRGAEVVPAVHAALDAGYRHIDTAAMYGNELEIGRALREHGTPRGEIFITTKVWPDEVAAGRLLQSAEDSLKRLQLDQVDLLLIHWPVPDMPVAEQVRPLCEAKRRGLTRHIGVSNFSPRQTEEAVAAADEPIVTNQIERNPWLDQSDLAEVCARHGVAVTSYSPLGKARNLDDPAIVEIARRHEKTPAQVVLRWHVQQPGNIAIPKSVNPRRLAENIDVFGFALTPEEMVRLSALAR